MSVKSVVEVILGERCIDALVRYLAAYKVVEMNYGLFDKLARARDPRDFSNALYEAMRVKDRVLMKLNEGVKRGEYEVLGEVRDVKLAFDVGSNCISKVLDLASKSGDIRHVGAVIASLALAYEGVKSRR